MIKLIIVFLFIGGACAIAQSNSCEKFTKGLIEIKSRNVGAKARVDAHFSTLPTPAESYDASWFYLEVQGIILPVPEKPKKLERDSQGSIVISSPKFTAVLGPDVTKESLAPIRDFANARQLRSDYDLNTFLYGNSFSKCNDIHSLNDAESKLKLAIIKSLDAPFEVRDIIRFLPVEAIVLAGPHKSHNGKFATYLIVKMTPSTSLNSMIFFSNPEDQAKFHSYVSKIRDKNFFLSGKALKL